MCTFSPKEPWVYSHWSHRVKITSEHRYVLQPFLTEYWNVKKNASTNPKAFMQFQSWIWLVWQNRFQSELQPPDNLDKDVWNYWLKCCQNICPAMFSFHQISLTHQITLIGSCPDYPDAWDVGPILQGGAKGGLQRKKLVWGKLLRKAVGVKSTDKGVKETGMWGSSASAANEEMVQRSGRTPKPHKFPDGETR